jgi:hypothetical protein
MAGNLLNALEIRERLRMLLKASRETNAADIISAVEFDHTGDYLATGDRGGRVVLFERNEGVRISI